MENGELNKAEKIAIIESEILEYKRVQFQAEMRMRVSQRIGDAKNVEALNVDLVRIETALVALEEEKRIATTPVREAAFAQ
jgi:hypothetical protein